ncbi:MAG: pitrilysin family protein [Polyangiales bacterium]
MHRPESARPRASSRTARRFALTLALPLAVFAPSAYADLEKAPSAKLPSAKTLATTSASAAAAPMRPRVEIERFTLDDGLRVVLNRDVSSPTVAVVVWYDVGSRNEQPGEGGFAHLFEHIMFEGSAKYPRGVHDKIVEGRGGKLNASTSEDWTRYWEMMPAGELGVTLGLEADRMHALKIDEEAFENQRKVVEEAYRMRVANAPYVPGFFRLMELAYEGYHPYAHPAIGSMKELDDAKLEWVKAFHDGYYAPNNAVLVVSGDFEVADAKALVHKQFDAVPRVANVKKYPDAPFAGRTKPSGPELVSDPFARTPMTAYAWSIPKSGEADHYALQLAAAILSDGESSRLQRTLVKDLAVAQSVSAGTEDHRGPDAFVLEAHLAEKGKLDDVEKRLLAAIDELGKKAPTEAEMKKSRAQIEHGLLFGLQSNLSRALTLATFEGERGDANLLTTEVDRYLAVTPEQVRAAVAKYLGADRVAHVRVMPPVSDKGDGGKGDKTSDKSDKTEAPKPPKAAPKKEAGK